MKVYKPAEFARKIGVATRTLKRWDAADILKAYRTPTNHRYYTHDQYVDYCLKSGMSMDDIYKSELNNAVETETTMQTDDADKSISVKEQSESKDGDS